MYAVSLPVENICSHGDTIDEYVWANPAFENVSNNRYRMDSDALWIWNNSRHWNVMIIVWCSIPTYSKPIRGTDMHDSIVHRIESNNCTDNGCTSRQPCSSLAEVFMFTVAFALSSRFNYIELPFQDGLCCAVRLQETFLKYVATLWKHINVFLTSLLDWKAISFFLSVHSSNVKINLSAFALLFTDDVRRPWTTALYIVEQENIFDK